MRRLEWIEEAAPLQEDVERGIGLFHWIQKMDERILKFIHRHFHCAFLNMTMPWTSFIGNAGAVWGVVMAVFLLMHDYRQYGMSLFGILVICGAITNFVLKPLVARPRPCHKNTEKHLLVNRPQDYSFPSGHTLSSFAAAMVIYNANQVWGVIAFVLAALIAFSRMYLYVHYPSDVLAGIIIGLGSSEPMVWVSVILLAFLYYSLCREKRRMNSQ